MANDQYACSPTGAQYYARLQEFQHVSALALLDSNREPTSLTLRLQGDVKSSIEGLIAKEKDCCPFMESEVTSEGSRHQWIIRVPSGAENCLDDLTRVADYVVSGRPRG